MVYIFRAIFYLLGVSSCYAKAEVETDEGNIETPNSSQNTQTHARFNSPEVVLKVQYDSGVIGGIYLAQYRKSVATGGEISVPDRSLLCQDLCHAGLGGQACGTACHDMIPVGLIELTSHDEETVKHINVTEGIGHPRVTICSILCDNNLGDPLCACGNNHQMQFLPNWSDVCNGFCYNYKYTARGCPTCDETKLDTTSLETTTKILDTYDGWTAWCDVQCRQGEGGAACNCDRSPF